MTALYGVALYLFYGSKNMPKTKKRKKAKPVKAAKHGKAAKAAKLVKPEKEKKEVAGKYEPIRKILEEQRATLIREAMAAINSTMNPELETYSDPGDQASAESDRNFFIRLKEREQKLIKKMELALEQIKNGTFGICEVCGKEIGIKRLKARPVATLCIECKTDAEKEEKARNL